MRFFFFLTGFKRYLKFQITLSISYDIKHNTNVQKKNIL
jgi:hypothetical protein